MDDRIIEFANSLRRNGVRVSPSENMDALAALQLLGIEDPFLFRSALRATLIKRSVDVRAFEEIFDLFFFGLGESIKESDLSLRAQMGLSPQEFQQLLEQIRNFLRCLDGNISELARALLSGDMGQVERLLREAAERLGQIQNGAQTGAAFQGIVFELGFSKVRTEFQHFKAVVAQLRADPETLEKISQYVDRRLQDLERMVRDLIMRTLKISGSAASERERLDVLSQKSFSYYTEEDIRKMNEVVTRLAQRFKNLLSVRRKKARRGRFDVKATLRKNLQYGGVPFHIRLDRRKKEKPQVIILCDISDSVLNASRFILQFVYSVQDLYSKVRSFVFVSDIGEVTQLFDDNEIHRAVDMALRGEVINVNCHSNFGRVFETFYREHLSAVTGKTTFLIIGDGRNNYNAPSDWALKEIQQRAKQLIWLNPESRLTWGLGDSEMPRYVPYCDLVEECRNIRQLTKVIDRLVP
jgi:uncharacterized protein with von Willebrand factor type A (vWA) domain